MYFEFRHDFAGMELEIACNPIRFPWRRIIACPRGAGQQHQREHGDSSEHRHDVSPFSSVVLR
jgi:hypothetical protein